MESSPGAAARSVGPAGGSGKEAVVVADAGDEWGVRHLDVDAYLARVGLPDLDRARPDERTLRLLHRAHVETIPFENIDIVLGRGVSTSIPEVQDRLVTSQRGGYCHQQGLLFGAVLDKLGYRVRRLLARPRERPGRPWPRTHLTLHAFGADGDWLADVGFGAGLLEPLPMAAGVWRTQGDWAFRLDAEGEDRRLMERLGASENLLYSFSGIPQCAADVDAANYYTSTHPDSPFTGQLVVMQRRGGELRRLLNREYSRIAPDGSSTRMGHLDDDELAAVLVEQFGLKLDAQEACELAARVRDTRSSLAGGP
ncbi:hypothetical protein AQI95_18045 [Streptomyces yokosukanensis]|uniref:Acetyltransferase n=1 Tax=Streptomyces yokosukanensis TaxID=67386 RepID=A0A101P4J1_9ACTN|nr:arylamine N-acetyltransferase [Streptomyces yokosukanensis]KUN04792.1 hypothetical protein AQI95_18045 [Streptomyces yokosukanensis]